MTLSTATHSAEDVIRALRLEPLPGEGGFFRRTAEASWFTSTPRGERLGWTMIHALFTPQQFSAFHRVASDELWCFHAGDPLELVTLDEHGAATRTVLGDGPLQHVVSAQQWQAARVVAGGKWSLVTCVVTPGFAWEDFELGKREAMVADSPKHRGLIEALTR